MLKPFEFLTVVSLGSQRQRLSMTWLIFVAFFALISINIGSATEKPKTFNYKIKEFLVPLDHFNFVNNKTFSIRYLYNDSFVDTKQKELTPIFFYTGNEGDIELFAQNSGFVWELAEKLKAYVVFAEHRYYGKSLPFGALNFNVTENLGYLSVEQVLEDNALLIRFLRNDVATTMPVVAFGGSYGGMLAAWLRMKYPYLVIGALAASAPILQFQDLVPCDIFDKITTSVFRSALSANCSENIKNTWSVLKNISTTDEGRKQLNAVFQFCKPLKQPSDIDEVFDYLEDVYGTLAMVNYPYENTFLAPLPAYPVRQFCLYLKQKYEGLDLVDALQKALTVYSNFTGTAKCLETKAYNPALGAEVWEMQTCNQMVMPFCSKNTMFRDKEWNFKEYSDKCYARFKLAPKQNDIKLRYGGREMLEFTSNIIFSNGLLDPWSGGGVLQSDNEDITIIIIPEGAHHIDMRAAEKDDPPSVKAARAQEEKIIRQWITQSRN